MGSTESAGGHAGWQAAGAGAFVAAVGIACWPAWAWAAGAWQDPSYAGAGLLAFVASILAIAIALGRASESQLRPSWMMACAMLLVLFGLLYPSLPMVLSASMAAGAMACAWLAVAPPNSGQWGIAALLLLSLPLGVGADFALGYPLRVFVTHAAAFALGPMVEPVGTALVQGERTVFVDAPCAGIRMLNIGLSLGAVIAAVSRASMLQTLLLLCAAGSLSIAGNIARAIALFFVEGLSGAPAWSHEAVGVGVFAGCVAVLVWLAPKRQAIREAAQAAGAARTVRGGPGCGARHGGGGLWAATQGGGLRRATHFAADGDMAGHLAREATSARAAAT